MNEELTEREKNVAYFDKLTQLESKLFEENSAQKELILQGLIQYWGYPVFLNKIAEIMVSERNEVGSGTI